MNGPRMQAHAPLSPFPFPFLHRPRISVSFPTPALQQNTSTQLPSPSYNSVYFHSHTHHTTSEIIAKLPIHQPSLRTPIRYKMANMHDVGHSARPSTSQGPSQPPDILTRVEGALPRREVDGGGGTVRVQAREGANAHDASSSAERNMISDPSRGGQCLVASAGENVAGTEEIDDDDERSIYYDCAPVIAATSHITNRRDVFVSYQPMHDTQIGGVGGRNSRVEGRGTIELESQCEGKIYVLTLQDVLYIPSNKHNLLSLGKWTAAGGLFIGGGGKLSLISKSGKCVAQGTKMENNLYKIRFTIRKPRAVPDRKATVGELTHIDLSEQYEASVNGHQYHLLFVDERARYMTVEFLKSRSEVTEGVKKYLSYLKNHDRKPRAIRVDGGKDIITGELRAWCAGRGIGIQVIALRSPVQIREDILAEQMNRTLGGLAHTLISAKGLPEFLWEPAVAHAAYLKNRLTAPTVEDSTPYQRWNDAKPNVSHLREFGAPVWIVRQGQELRREQLPLAKGHRRSFVGYDETEGTRSVKFYDAKTKKVLATRNFRLLTPPDQVDPEGTIAAAFDTITPKLEEESAGAGGSPLRRAPSGVARDGARVADTGNAAVHGGCSCSVNIGAPNGLKRKRGDLDVGESTRLSVTRGKMPQY